MIISLPSVRYGVILCRLRNDASNVVSVKVGGQSTRRAARENHFIRLAQTFGHQGIKDGSEYRQSLEMESDSIMYNRLIPGQVINYFATKYYNYVFPSA